MKEIKAIIRPFKMPEVIDALRGIEDLPGLTISEIRGFGRTLGSSLQEQNAAGVAEQMPRIKLEVVVSDDRVDEIVDVIQRHAHTGNSGDGKIFVLPVADAVKIRTNVHGESAL
jgi:nitrogen regulatory protein P-II 1